MGIFLLHPAVVSSSAAVNTNEIALNRYFFLIFIPLFLSKIAYESGFFKEDYLFNDFISSLATATVSSIEPAKLSRTDFTCDAVPFIKELQIL